MTTFFIKCFTWLNAFLFRSTRGRWGSRVGKQSVLLLKTVGRRTGKIHLSPLSYYRDGSTYLLVASNWGKENPPDWFLNLLQKPETTIQEKDVVIQVKAREAQGAEYERLWNLVTRNNTQYVDYQKAMKRIISIVILTPLN